VENHASNNVDVVVEKQEEKYHEGGIKRSRPDENDDEIVKVAPPTQKIRHEENSESKETENNTSTTATTTIQESKQEETTTTTTQPPTTKMITITTTLPEGCKPGDTMMAPYGTMGQMTSFVVPEGSKPGDTLELTLPAVIPQQPVVAPPSIYPPPQQNVGFPGLAQMDPTQLAQMAARLVQLGIPPSMWHMAPGMMPFGSGQAPGTHIPRRPKKQLTKEERDTRNRKQAIAQGFRKELAYRRKLYRSHSEPRPDDTHWPPLDPSDPSKTMELPRIAVANCFQGNIVEQKYESEKEEIHDLWEKRFWLALAKKKIPKQPKMHAVLWCEALLHQASLLGIQSSHSLIKTLKEDLKTSLAKIQIKGSRSAQRLNVRIRMGGQILSFEGSNRKKPYLRPANRLLALIKKSKKKKTAGSSDSTMTTSSLSCNLEMNNIPRLSSSSSSSKKSKKKKSASLEKRVRKGQWMDDWSNWIVYETRRDNESLETISRLAGVPPLNMLWKWNRRRYPSIKKSSPLILGTHVLIRPDHEKIHGPPPAPVWKGKPWKPRVGVRIQARWNGGREVGFPGYYPATVMSVSKNKKILGLKYVFLLICFCLFFIL
jgi:hypothetical protein